MRIGILTFHRAENFGATLQAYALQTYLSQQGHEAIIIDYRCPAIEMSYDLYNPRIILSRKNVIISLKSYLCRFKNIKDRILKKKRFERFWSTNYHLTNSFNSIKSDIGFDAYITGSDQVWNLHLTNGIDNMFFLSFPMKEGAKKISYAASSENDPNGLLQKNKDAICRLLSSFDHISVREDFLKAELNEIVDMPITVCMDPTFLLDKKYYAVLSKKPMINDKYVLVYHMTPKKEAVKLADRIASTRGYKVIEVFGGYKNYRDSERYKCDLGPSEILGYIQNAEIVITTSFHGLALSVIMNKEFWVINHSGNYRQKNLLNLLDLNDRLINKHEECPIDELIDYARLKSVLAVSIEKSKQFIIEALG